MLQKIKTINLLVNDYDEAVKFYTEKLGFQINQFFPEQNWVTLKTPGSKEDDVVIALCKADEESKPAVGKQTGTYGLFIMAVDDCKNEYERMKAEGIEFTMEPKASDYGTYTMLKDLYGNNIFMSDSKFFK